MELSRTVGAVQTIFNDLEKCFLGIADEHVFGSGGSKASVNPAQGGVSSNAAVALAAAIVDDSKAVVGITTEATAANIISNVSGGGADAIARAVYASFVYKFGVPALAQFKLVALFDAVRLFWNSFSFWRYAGVCSICFFI